MIPAWVRCLPSAQQARALEEWSERAAIMQFDGGMSRDAAEQRAGELVRKSYVQEQGVLL